MDLAVLLAERPPYPARVVCLTEETTETLYRIGAGDLVVGFSDLQVDLARDLIRRGVPVLITNQRSVAEILQTVRLVAGAVGRAEAGEGLGAGPAGPGAAAGVVRLSS